MSHESDSELQDPPELVDDRGQTVPLRDVEPPVVNPRGRCTLYCNTLALLRGDVWQEGRRRLWHWCL